MDGKFDARTVNLHVKKYFESLGTNVLLFKVESVTYDKDSQHWFVECSFYDSFIANKQLAYKVEVDANTGEIVEVKQLKET